MRGRTSIGAARTEGSAAPRLVRLALSALLAIVAGVGIGPGDVAAGAQRTERTGTIRGRVDVRRPAEAAVRPQVADLVVPRDRDRPDRYRSVVYLESAPRGAFDAGGAGRVTLDQRNETFVPHVLAIMTGTVVDFPNSDDFYHNVFSLSKARRFDLGRYAAGRSKSVRFDEPGIVRVFCEIHSHMNAFILVFAHPFFSVTDGDGRYQIGDVPAGTYGVVAWNEGVASGVRQVTVTPGSTVDLDFSVR